MKAAGEYCRQAMAADPQLVECRPSMTTVHEAGGTFAAVSVTTHVQIKSILLGLIDRSVLSSTGRALARPVSGISEADSGKQSTVGSAGRAPAGGAHAATHRATAHRRDGRPVHAPADGDPEAEADQAEQAGEAREAREAAQAEADQAPEPAVLQEAGRWLSGSVAPATIATYLVLGAAHRVTRRRSSTTMKLLRAAADAHRARRLPERLRRRGEAEGRPLGQRLRVERAGLAEPQPVADRRDPACG